MYRKYKFLFNKLPLFFLSAFLIFSCTPSDDGDFPEPLPVEKLFGTWELDTLSASPGRATGISIIPLLKETINYQITVGEIFEYRITFENSGDLLTTGSFIQNNDYQIGEDTGNIQEQIAGGIVEDWSVEFRTLTITSPFNFSTEYIVESLTNDELIISREVNSFIQTGDNPNEINIFIDSFPSPVPLLILGASYVETRVYRKV